MRRATARWIVVSGHAAAGCCAWPRWCRLPYQTTATSCRFGPPHLWPHRCELPSKAYASVLPSLEGGGEVVDCGASHREDPLAVGAGGMGKMSRRRSGARMEEDACGRRPCEEGTCEEIVPVEVIAPCHRPEEGRTPRRPIYSNAVTRIQLQSWRP